MTAPSAMHPALLTQIAIALVAATVAAFGAQRLRQPILIALLLGGMVVGDTAGVGLVHGDTIEPVAELGLILMLFMIGLEIDLKKLRESGRTLLATGGLQFPLGVLLGLPVCWALAQALATRGPYDALYLSIAFALSSTTIVVKLLYEKFELDGLPGRITLGVLVFQDLWAILFLGLQPDLASPKLLGILLTLAKIAGLVAASLLASRFVLPRIFHAFARQPEFLVLGALGWCFAVVLGAGALGLSLEMGALIAGVALSTFPYNMDVAAKVIGLRDFFITLFFVTLGTRIALPTPATLGLAVAGTAFVAASRLLTVAPVAWWAGNGLRASLLPAINLAQVSEFSLVIASIGRGLGHLSPDAFAVIVLTFVLTALASTYGIQHNHAIHERMGDWLLRLGWRDREQWRATQQLRAMGKDYVLLGFIRDTSSLLHELRALDPSVSPRLKIVDFNPEVHAALTAAGLSCTYGDIAHPDVLRHAHVGAAEVVVSTIPDRILRGTTNARLLEALKAMAPEARFVMTSETISGAQTLYDAGAHWVHIPRLHDAVHLARVVREAKESDLADLRRLERDALAARREVLD
ncbi:MAG: cation:proton antiporter [Gemmatimonadota bacterium]